MSIVKGSLPRVRICICIAICLSLAGCGGSRDGDTEQMKQMSKKFTTAIDEALKNEHWSSDEFIDPRITACWSCVFAREITCVKGQPPEFAPRSPDEDQQRFYKKEEWPELIRSISLRADRKVHFDEQQYKSFLKKVMGTEDYAKVEAIRQHWQYFEQLKKDYEP